MIGVIAKLVQPSCGPIRSPQSHALYCAGSLTSSPVPRTVLCREPDLIPSPTHCTVQGAWPHPQSHALYCAGSLASSPVPRTVLCREPGLIPSPTHCTVQGAWPHPQSHALYCAGSLASSPVPRTVLCREPGLIPSPTHCTVQGAWRHVPWYLLVFLQPSVFSCRSRGLTCDTCLGRSCTGATSLTTGTAGSARLTWRST